MNAGRDMGTKRIDNGLLDGANIGDDGACLQCRADGRADMTNRADRNADKYNIGINDAAADIDGHFISDAELLDFMADFSADVGGNNSFDNAGLAKTPRDR